MRNAGNEQWKMTSHACIFWKSLDDKLQINFALVANYIIAVELLHNEVTKFPYWMSELIIKLKKSP